MRYPRKHFYLTMKRTFILLLLVSLEISVAYSQTIRTINVEFTRHIERENSKETATGSIYYNNTRTILKIIEPIFQWVIITGDSMLIYYPVEKQALLIKSDNPATLPFLNMFIGVVKENFGLAESGYSIRKNEMRGDTLFTYWDPSPKSRKFMGPVTLALVQNKLVLSESKNPQGKTIIRTIYQNHVRYRTKHFPLQITIFQYSEPGITIETVVFFNPTFDEPFPPEIANFCIPGEIELEAIEW